MTTTGRGDRARDVSWAGLLVGIGFTMVSFVALVVAALNFGHAFSASGTDADLGVGHATQVWAGSLGILGVAVIFGVAIGAALTRVRTTISDRRDALVATLPQRFAARA